MARLGEPFSLGSFHGTIAGVSQCRLEGPVLSDYVTEGSQKEKTKAKDKEKKLADDFVTITVQDSGVHVYNTNDQKCVKSWSVKPGFNFSQPAIQHPKTENFYVIQRDKIIHSWALGSELEKGHSRETGKNLFALKASSLSNNLIAVTKEGQVGIYDPSLHLLGEFYTPSKKIQREILWSTLFEVGSSIHLLNFGTEGDGYVLTLFTISPQENTIARNVTFGVAPPKEKNYPIACDFDPVNNRFILIWSGYVWQLFDIQKKFFSSKRESASLQASKEVPLSGFEGVIDEYAKTIKKKSNLFGKSGFACAFIQPSFVAFVGMKKNSNVITVWDLQYGIVHAEQNLERNTFEPSQLSDSFKLEASYISSSSGGFLIMVDVTTVWASSFTVSPISLMDVIGKMSDTAKFLSEEGVNTFLLPPAPAIVNIPQGGEEDVEQWKQIIENNQAIERRAMEILVNPEKTPTKESFTKEFFKYVNTKIPEQEGMVVEPTDERQKPVHISHHFIANIIERCFNEERFFPLQVLDFMICSKLLSVSETKMLQKLVEKKELGLIEKCLIHIYDIPEPDLVKLLKFFLTEAKEEDLKKYLDEKQMAGEKVVLPGDTAADFFLCLITSAPRNDIFLQTSVKALTFSEVMVLLTFLRKMVQRHSENLYTTLKEQVTTRIPTFAQVLDWSSVVLDAHFAQLVLSKEIHPLLKELQVLVSAEADCCDKMETLPGRLSQFLSKGALPTKKMGSYCIEVMQI